jgi:hypothetical protein
MRVYDLEQGRSVERLDGHARIKPLPTKLFMPGQRVFTPRYRLFIPSSTNLSPAVMLRFDRPVERTVGPPLCCRLGCRVTKPGRGEDRREGFRHKYFRYAARAGCHWVRREDVKRLKDLERENATLKRFLADAELDPARSGCDVAVLAEPLRQGPSATGFRPPITTPAQKARQSITRKCNAFGA